MCIYCVYSKQIQLDMFFLWRKFRTNHENNGLDFSHSCSLKFYYDMSEIYNLIRKGKNLLINLANSIALYQTELVCHPITFFQFK